MNPLKPLTNWSESLRGFPKPRVKYNASARVFECGKVSVRPMCCPKCGGNHTAISCESPKKHKQPRESAETANPRVLWSGTGKVSHGQEKRREGTFAELERDASASSESGRRGMPVVIHFDGGTPCNIPARGYGIGYGSYSLNGGAPVRVSHGIPCSSNTAEILTLCCALDAVESRCVHVQGDSQIALKWLGIAAGARKGKLSPASSPEFKQAIRRLGASVRRFDSVTYEWLPREHAVRRFGH